LQREAPETSQLTQTAFPAAGKSAGNVYGLSRDKAIGGIFLCNSCSGLRQIPARDWQGNRQAFAGKFLSRAEKLSKRNHAEGNRQDEL
jgi:hypothetical protein